MSREDTAGFSGKRGEGEEEEEEELEMDHSHRKVTKHGKGGSLVVIGR